MLPSGSCCLFSLQYNKTIAEKEISNKLGYGSFRKQAKTQMTVNLTFFAIFITINLCAADMDHLQDIMREITRRYFHVFTCIAYVTDDTVQTETIPFNSTTMIISWTAKASVHVLTKAYEENCNGFLVQVSTRNRFPVVADLVYSYKKSLYSRYNNKRYLFLPVEEGDDDDIAFLDTEYMYYMPNLVFVATSGDAFRIIGHNFFNGYKYDVLGIKHEVLDFWHPGNGFKYDADLYPDKMSNLNGKLVVFSMLNYKPFAIVRNVSDGETIYDGVETRAAAQFVESSNGTWKGLDNPVHQWGELFENGSGNGVFGTVSEHIADFGYSAIYQFFCDVLDCSRPFIYSDVTCLVPKPDIISGWLTIVLPFQPAVWSIFFCCYIASGLFTFFLSSAWRKATGSRKLGLFDSLYDTYRLQLGQVPRSAMRTAPTSGFYRVWGLYTFLVALLWQCGISSFLTVPTYEKAINEATDMVERYPALHWGATHTVWVESIREAEEPALKKIVKEFVVADAATLRNRVPEKNFAYFTERLQNGYYALNTYIDSNAMKYLKVMEKKLYRGNVVIIMTRGSPYQERLDEILIRMIDTGLMKKLEEQIAIEWLDRQLQYMVRSSAEHKIRKATILRVVHIHGALYIFAIGIILSFAAFIVEKIHFRTVGQTKNRILFRRSRLPS